jgi:hypothetical protein
MIYFKPLLVLLFTQSRNDGAGAAIFGGTLLSVFYLVIAVIVFASYWKLFEKAGKPGWAGIVPIYNIVVMLEIIGKPIWWLVMLLIPCANIVFFFMINIELAKRFGKDTLYGVLMTLFGVIMYPILAFGDAVYTPPPPEGTSITTV